ncbi:hypothetical protein BBK14_08340 [Parafrankia soli]|uniref:Uncharacterized protein n=1 Tax=Parafrankia soli TaxID=2599596 RepID=A0A1S1PGK8_9ACTN|nr:hypothetical protein BBK14_08340 [Parafrankia soli]
MRPAGPGAAIAPLRWPAGWAAVGENTGSHAAAGVAATTGRRVAPGVEAFLRRGRGLEYVP